MNILDGTRIQTMDKNEWEQELELEEKFLFFWNNAAKYGRLEVMEWAHQQGYSHVQCLERLAWNKRLGRKLRPRWGYTRAQMLSSTGNSMLWNGCKNVAVRVHRANGCVQLLLKVVTCLSSNGWNRMAVHGVQKLAPLQLIMGIPPFSNGRERMAVHGMYGLVGMQLKWAFLHSQVGGGEWMSMGLLDIFCSWNKRQSSNARVRYSSRMSNYTMDCHYCFWWKWFF